MGQISIRLTDENERELKRIAREKGKSLAEFCREVILDGHKEYEQPLNRATIESEIDELKQSIERINRNISVTTKILLEKILMNNELTTKFLDAVYAGNEEAMLEAYNEATVNVEEKLKSYFR